jgi:bacterioferritin-associated ferredoxin
MIICSGKVIRDKQPFSVLAAHHRLPPISQVYAGMGCRAGCGLCVPAINRLE